jgi:Rrf2 family transcriptional regulator, iron-sulfur cluster assembly transcription factor
MISNTCKYAIRAVIYLGYKEEKNINTGIKEIAKELDIPMPFLGKILQTLAKQKLLISTKGPNGGFHLGRLPKDITIVDIIEVIDGLDSFKNCFIGIQSCSSGEKPCATHSTYAPLRDEIFKLFRTSTIEDYLVDIRDGKEINL